MAFYDVISRKLSEKSQEAYQYGRNMADTMKYNSLIAEEEKYIDSLYFEIGQLYVELYKGNYHEEIIEKINLINNSIQRIEEYKFQLSEVSGFVICPNCGNRTNSKAAFCSVCGSRIIKNTDGRKKICPACRSVVGDNDEFCMECGHTLKSPKPQELKRCPSCNAVVKDDMAFCIECGYEFRRSDSNYDKAVLQNNAITYKDGNGIKNEALETKSDEQDYSENIDENIILDPKKNTQRDQEKTPLFDTPRFCTECGTRLESDEIFCIKCGTKCEL